MINKIEEVFQHILTEKDGDTYCPARILWVLGTLVYLAFAIYQVFFLHTQLNYTDFAAGFAAIQAAGSAAVRIKIQTEQ